MPNISYILAIVFTDTGCYFHKDRHDFVDAFLFDEIESVQKNEKEKTIQIILTHGGKKQLPIVSEALCDYFSAINDDEKYENWKKEQVVAALSCNQLLLSILLSSVSSLGILIFLFKGRDASGAEILAVTFIVYFPAQVVAYYFVSLWDALKKGL